MMLNQLYRHASWAALGAMAMLVGACQPDPVDPPVISAAVVKPVDPPVAEVQDTPMAEPAAQGAILLNQHGYMQGSDKIAVLIRDAAAPVSFSVLDAAGGIMLSGQSVNYGLNIPSGQRVHHLDFSALRQVGSGYQVRVGAVSSHPFDIAGRPYAELTTDALRYYYMARIGEPVLAEHVPAQTPPLTRPAGHTSEQVSCFAGLDRRGTNWPGCAYTLDLRGGWYDAGDYGKYAVNTGITTWILLNMVEYQKQSFTGCERSFADGDLSMPENNDGQNDLLNEARYGILYLLRSQIQTTDPVAMARGPQRATGPLTIRLENGQGMAHHKVHGRSWASGTEAPHLDTAPRDLYPPSTAATLHLAAVGAKCARLYKYVDPALSKVCLARAELAFAAATRIPDAYAHDNFDGGGPSNDSSLEDEFAWAATELFLTTGKADYETAMTTHRPEFKTFGDLYWAEVDHLATLSIVGNARNIKRADLTPLQRDAIAALETLAGNFQYERGQTGFAIPYSNANYYWGSNGTLLGRAMIMAYAHDQTGDKAYKQSVVDVMDYLLGRNPLNQSYISGYGETPMRNPHHRFWSNSVNANAPRVPPGVVSGGPNNGAMVDPVARALEGRCTGQTCWADDYEAYALNEVTINWNAPLAWTAHWLDRQTQNCSYERPKSE